VLDESGERLLSLSSRLGTVPHDAYAALSTADAQFPTITLSTGESVQVSYGQYRKLLATCRSQLDRRKAYEALYDTYGMSLNTYAALYNGVMQREWFQARARGYASTLDAALFGNDIPPASFTT
jgi:oligoendopeptidase F